jgi:hypothetical protein
MYRKDRRRRTRGQRLPFENSGVGRQLSLVGPRHQGPGPAKCPKTKMSEIKVSEIPMSKTSYLLNGFGHFAQESIHAPRQFLEPFYTMQLYLPGYFLCANYL